MLLVPHVSVPQDAQPFSVRSHETVLDAVVDHLDEVTSAVGTAVQVTLFGGAVKLFASRRAWYVTRPRRQRREDWIEVLNHSRFASDHHAVAALQAPHT